MSNGFSHVGPTDPDTLSESDCLVLHIEPDETIQATVATAITEHNPNVDIVAVTSGEQAGSLLSELRVDCVVSGTTDASLDGIEPPLVIYTGGDVSELGDSVLEDADTLVESQSGAKRAAFLARKVLSLAESESGRTQHALARALSRAEISGEHETHQFLVDSDGTVVWASTAFESVFPVEQSGGPLPDTDNFDERLHALLAESPEAIATVTRTKRDADPTQRESFTVQNAVEKSQFVHTGYQLPPALGSLRLEVFEHVTADVQREARIELLEVLVEASEDGLYTLDSQGNIEFCNASFAEMLGYDAEELIGRHASSVLVDGELEQGQSRIEELLTGDGRDSATVDLTFRTRSGETLEIAIHFTLLTAEDGSYAGLMGVARDITERKARERELQKYRQLVEAARDPMFVLDTEGRITLFNKAMQRITDEEVTAGRPLTTLFAGHEQLAGILNDLQFGEREWEQYELRLPDGAGGERLYEATVGALRDEAGFVGTVGTLRDITERNRRIHELDLLKQVLARVLRHNIRSKFTVIQSHADRLVRGEADPRVAGEAIQETAESLLATTEKAREIERLVDSDVDRRALDLPTIVSRAVDSVARNYPDASYDIDVPSVTVRAHPDLETAVENAVENAVVHTKASSVTLTTSETDERVELRIVDAGAGIPETELATLEEHEETPLQHTSGAGLWLIDWLVERSGGNLTFETGPEGTTVSFELDRE